MSQVLARKAGESDSQENRRPQNGRQEDQPAVGVSWGDALKFAHWKQMRLPTETEWEFAARGPEGWLWPWGNQFVSENLIYSYNAYSRTAPVGDCPNGASWVGALDMSGNTWDWCLSAWRDDYSAAENNQTKPATQPRVLRGGSYLDSADQTRVTVRTSDDPIFGNVNIGFRLVCMAPVPEDNY
jgi:formylglycine-generating enzyme required for sulfatase activity